jgi:ribosomal protein S18 acetylase RimI-like enzyme
VDSLPAPGTRVSLRYRRPAGSVPPLTDVIGHLLDVAPRLRVRTKAGEIVEVAAADVVAVRALTDAPVRTSQIRATEHAAALAWPGTEQHWLAGWLLRAGPRDPAGHHTHRANSAVPLDVCADATALPAILDWYARRGLPPLLAIPDRLLSLPAGVPAARETLVMVRALPAGAPDPLVQLAARPDDAWLALYDRPVPVDVLRAVLGGEVVFASRAGAGVARGAVTEAPDGSRWVGLSAVQVAGDQRRRGHARALCATLLSWGAQRRAARAYVQVLTANTAAIALYQSMGFGAQHRGRYVDAAAVLSGSSGE